MTAVSLALGVVAVLGAAVLFTPEISTFLNRWRRRLRRRARSGSRNPDL